MGKDPLLESTQRGRQRVQRFIDGFAAVYAVCARLQLNKQMENYTALFELVSRMDERLKLLVTNHQDLANKIETAVAKQADNIDELQDRVLILEHKTNSSEWRIEKILSFVLGVLQALAIGFLAFKLGVK